MIDRVFEGARKLTEYSQPGYHRSMAETSGETQQRSRYVSLPNQELLRRDTEAAYKHVKGFEELPESLKQSVQLKDSMNSVERHLLELGQKGIEKSTGTAEAPGTVLRKEESWAKYGWQTEKVAEVGKRLEEVLGKENNLSSKEEEKRKKTRQSKKLQEVYESFDSQIQATFQLLVATGQKPEEIIGLLTPETITQAKEAADNRELNRYDYPWQYFLFRNILGVHDEYVKHYILPEEFSTENQQEYQRTPQNAEELAWQMAHYRSVSKWGPGGEFPLLEMRIVPQKSKNGTELKDSSTGDVMIDSEKSKLFINESNIVRWIRNYEWKLHDADPEKVPNVFGDVALKKDFGGVNMNDMYVDWEKYLVSADGKIEYQELATQILLEGAMFLTLRQLDVELRPVLADANKLLETVMKFFDRSPLTRALGPKNLLYFIMSAPLDFESAKEGESQRTDGIMGGIWNHLNMAYWHLSDIEKLKEVLGKDSSFFTKQGMRVAMEKVWEEKQGFTGEVIPNAFLPQDVFSKFEAAFYADEEDLRQLESDYAKTTDEQKRATLQKKIGEIKAIPKEKWGKLRENESETNNFKKLVNFFPQRTPSQAHKSMIRQALTDSMTEIYGEKVVETDEDTGKEKEVYKLLTKDGKEDKDTLRIAELWSYSWNLISGAAVMNLEGAPAFIGSVKWQRTGEYADKYFLKNGGLGNPLNVGLFKQTAAPFPQVIHTAGKTPVTELVRKRDESGRIIFKTTKDADGNIDFERDKRGNKVPEMEQKVVMKDGKPMLRDKTLFDVMEQLQQVSMARAQHLRSLREGVEKEEDPTKKAALAKKLERDKNQTTKLTQGVTNELEFAEDAQNAYAVDHLRRGAQFYDMLSGAKQMNFEKFMKKTIFGPQFDRTGFQEEMVSNYITVLRYGFGAGDINYGAIVRAKVTEPKDPKKPWGEKVEKFVYMPKGEEMFGYQVLNRAEFWKRRPNGKPEKDENGRNVIDYSKLETKDGRALLWKSVALTKLATDLKSHLSVHMDDPNWSYAQKMNLINAVASIPGPVDVDGHDIGKIRQKGYLFSKKDMKFLRHLAKAEHFDLLIAELVGLPFGHKESKGPGFLGTLVKQFTLAA